MNILLFAAAALAQAPETPGLLQVMQARETSGTAWQPDAAPMIGWHGGLGDVDLMAHGNVFAGYDAQLGPRGDQALVSMNWAMGMASFRRGRHQLTGRAMLSLEPLTLPGDGYPLLLQSGETWEGKPLRDRQHPHDLLMELGGLYRLRLAPDLGVELYAALSGEPALGPGGFPHRQSSWHLPFAPLGHHWQDSTHIAHGVVTGGVFSRVWKLEGSWFNGREPDEARWDLDLAPFDSWSLRGQLAPGRRWSLGASIGRLDEPELLHPGAVWRGSASVAHTRRLGRTGFWATTAAWGRNHAVEDDLASDSFLVETTWDDAGSGPIAFGRAELVWKSAEELVLDGFEHERLFPLGQVSPGVGYGFDLQGGTLAAGIVANVAVVPDDLVDVYDTRFPVGGMVFVQAHPPILSRAAHREHAEPAPEHPEGHPRAHDGHPR